MSTEILDNQFKKQSTIKRVNVETLKNRIITQKKKEKLQSRIILASLVFTIGLIGYLVL